MNERPRACIPGRQVDIRLRDRRTKKDRHATLVCPATWTKGRLLEYCRACHPDEAVVIVDWHSVGDSPWRPTFWIPNPAEMVQ